MAKDFDRVYEVYMDSAQTNLTEKTRERIRWICTQAAGETVLDIGCSQGITSILLGREHKKVLALDIAEPSICFAKQRLQEEEPYVRQNVTFVAEDFVSCDFHGRIFDTIIMGEVLEHVFDTELFLKKAAACASSHSKLILTVPFGINDHWDHKRTYYFSRLYEQLEPQFKITSTAFFGGKWLGVTAVLRTENSQTKTAAEIVPDKQMMLQEEEYFFHRERRLLDDLESYRQQAARQKEKTDHLKIKGQEQRSQIENLRERNEKLKTREQEQHGQIENLRERNEKLKAREQEQRIQIENLRERNEKLKTREQEQRIQIENLRERNEKLKAREQEQRKQIEDLRERNRKIQTGEQEQQKQMEHMQETEEKQQAGEQGQYGQMEQLQQYEAEAAFLKRRVKVLDRRWRTASQRLETLQRKYDDLNKRYTALESSVFGKAGLFAGRAKSYLKRKLSAVKANHSGAGQIESGQIAADRATENGITTDAANNQADASGRTAGHNETDTAGRTVQGLPAFMQETVILNDTYPFDWKDGYLALRDAVCDTGYLEKMADKIAQIPDSSGSRYFGKMHDKIGMIADEFLFRSYADIAEIIYLTPEQYQYDIDLLLVATSWKGLHNEWKGLGNVKNTAVRNKLYHIIAYYQKLGKKVVFYSKEDPSNYYVFLDIAKKCDYIFTTAEECVEYYKKDTGIPHVSVLDFSINPIQFHPIGMQMFHFDEVLFAGTWWNKKYPERKEDTEIIFESVLKAGKKLKIIDRNYSLEKPDYFYPEKYLKFVSPELPHATLQKIHKMHSWSININSIKNSNTMFASRVYELMAQGNLIISNHSKGMERHFPNVIVEDGSGRAEEALLSCSEEDIYRKKIDGIRRVMTGETAFERMNEILACIGGKTENYEKLAGIIISDEHVEELYAMAEAQTYPYRKIIRQSSLDEDRYHECDIIAFFDSNSIYSEYYLEDMINAFKYTDCDFITKQAYYLGDQLIAGTEHNYVEDYEEAGRTVFWRESYAREELLAGNAHNSRNGYSIDHFHYTKRIEGTGRNKT